MRWLIIPLLLLSSITHASDYVGYIKDTNYFYAKGSVYKIHDNKAYKVIVVDGEYLTSNEWFPLDETGYTKEHVQMVKERQAKYANDFIKKNRGY